MVMTLRFNLDHINTSISGDQFKELNKLGDLFHNTDIVDVKTENFKYQGIYFRTEDGHYLEILN